MSRRRVYDVALSPVRIDPRVNQTRAPILPAVARGREFERRFDHLTLFYDVFREATGEAILAVGPHVPAHLDPETDIRFHDLATGSPLEADFLPSRGHIHGDMYRVHAGRDVSALRVTFSEQVAIVAVQPNLSPLFAGRRVLTNRCHNDPIQWLVDWAWFHVHEFGFDAIIHYDNGSTAYSVEDARLALSRIPGLEMVVVLSWPFPLEPPPATSPQTGQIFWRQLKDRWAESARLEHQRRRFLAQAELVLVADVDELLVQRNPGVAIDELFADPEVAWVRFISELVVNTADPPEGLLRHRDLFWIRDEPAFKTPKYLVKPDRCPDEARWWLHDVAWARGIDVSPDDYVVAHFFALTTGWGGKGARARKQTPLPGVHHEDLSLRGKLARVFHERAGGPPPWEPPQLSSPHLLRQEAYDLLRAGDRQGARDRLHRAMMLDPYHPVQHQVRRELLEEE